MMNVLNLLNRLRIGPRLLLLLSVQTLLLMLIGYTAVSGLRFASDVTARLNKSVGEQVALNQMNEVLRADMLGAIDELRDGRVGVEQGEMNLEAARNLFMSRWDEYKADKTPVEIEELQTTLEKNYRNVLVAFAALQQALAEHDTGKFSAFVDSRLMPLVDPFLTDLNERVAEEQLQSEQLFADTTTYNLLYLVGTIAVVLLGLGAAAALGYYLYQSIARPIRRIAETVDKVADGDYYARTEITGPDEMGMLGVAFDHLLDERVASLVQVERENERLNDSIVALLQAVSKLSQRDLTVKVPVTEDVTGPVADALNQLTAETARVLTGVRRIAEQVAKASTTVRTQSDVVIAVAASEQGEIDETANALAQAAATLNHIAELTQSCDQAAEEAANATHTALQTVTGTVEGINAIRATIHETEKRIKRLGERSQEVGRAINLISNIAERTHILALNASMHAAAAGEAGRGFAVVADEVQRLAENARDATQQIATLVTNIQAETGETVATMDKAIAQVVEGSRLAGQAGDHMLRTKDSTARLVGSVRQIAEDAADQIRLSGELQQRAQSIQDSTRKTRSQLEEQNQHTRRLVQYARGLLTAVQVFTLPAAPAAPVVLGNAAPDAVDADVPKMKAG